MLKKSLVTNCYVLGAGAFGVFVRWLQRQIAFDDNGLVSASIWNIILVLYIGICCYLAWHYVSELHRDGYSVPGEFTAALKNSGVIYRGVRIVVGAVMVIGGAVLIFSCETDKEASLLRVVGLLGILSGVSYPLMLASANLEAPNRTFARLCSFVPMLFFAVWLIAAYKINAINSVIWSYSIEIITISLCILAFFRMAGFIFGSPSSRMSMFMAMITAFFCFMSLADSRYFGMQLMLIGAGLMLLFSNWLMIANLDYVEPEAPEEPDDGFERLK